MVRDIPNREMRTHMAAEGDVDRMTRSHRNTYHFFTGLMKWGTIISAITAIIVIIIIRA